MKKKNVHKVAAESADNTHDIDDVVFLGPITATPINSSNVNVVACKQKALLEVKISAKEGGRKTRVVCKIDSGAETNILPKPIYDTLLPHKPSLRKSAVKLCACGGPTSLQWVHVMCMCRVPTAKNLNKSVLK